MGENKIDLTSTILEKGIDSVSGFLVKLAGSSIEEAGLMFGDKVKLRRLRNQIKIFSEAKKIAEDNNISIKQINLKTLVPLLEFSSLEEDETLQQKWSNLIVNFSNSNEKYESSIFPFILNQLTSSDILLLELLYNNPMTGVYIVTGIEKPNLIRLGLIEAFNPARTFYIQRSSSKIANQNKFILSELGVLFYRCCSTIKD